MEQDKGDSIECNIPYEPAGGLARLISEGYDTVKRGGFKPRFLEFVGDDISLHINSNKNQLFHNHYFDASMICYINFKLKNNIRGKLKDLTSRIIKYFLEIPDPSMELCMCPGEGKEGRTHHLSIHPKFSLNDGKDYVELSIQAGSKYQEEFLKEVLGIIGVRDITYGRALIWERIRERLKNQLTNNDSIGGTPKKIQITVDSVLSTYECLLDSKMPFYSYLGNSIKGPNTQLFRYSPDGSIKDINKNFDPSEFGIIYLFFSSEPYISISIGYEKGFKKELSRFEELLNSLQGGIVFGKIVYDTKDLRHNEEHDNILKVYYKKLSSGQISVEDYRKYLEQEYFRYYRERGDQEEEAKNLAQDMTKTDPRITTTIRINRELFLLIRFIRKWLG